MTLPEFGLLLLSIATSMIGQLLLKSGALKLGAVSASNALRHILGIITIPDLLGGLALYGVGAVAYILLLTRVNLSIAYPIVVAMSSIVSVLIGVLIFRETLPIARTVGLGFLVLGVVLVIWQK